MNNGQLMGYFAGYDTLRTAKMRKQALEMNDIKRAGSNAIDAIKGAGSSVMDAGSRGVDALKSAGGAAMDAGRAGVARVQEGAANLGQSMQDHPKAMGVAAVGGGVAGATAVVLTEMLRREVQRRRKMRG